MAVSAVATTLAVFAAGPARSQTAPPPVALVVANSNYAAFPKLPTCDLSANLVSAVLTRAGFKVARLTNVSNARLGTAIAAVGDDAAAPPGRASLIYVCGYAVAYADRLFVLPAEARLDRDPDVLSQGIVARLLMSSVAGPGSPAGLVLMDVGPPPGKAPLDFASMLRPSDAAHGGLIAAALPATDAPGPAPLASALSESVGDGRLEAGALLATLAARPSVRRSLLTVRPPADPSWLIGAPAPEPPPPPPPPLVVAAPEPPPVAAAAPAPADALAEPNAADRRRLQVSLGRLGYYQGRVDGLFATDTLAAIRQFQRDSNAEPTGKLTVKQMDKLLQ